MPVHGNVAAWWKFAISAVSAPISRRMQRERSTFVSARAKLLVQYVDLYAKMLSKHEIKVCGASVLHGHYMQFTLTII